MVNAKLKFPTKIPKMSKTKACRNKEKDKKQSEYFFKPPFSEIRFAIFQNTLTFLMWVK